MKPILTGFTVLLCLTAGAQSIFNGIGPGGVFKVNQGSNDYFTVNQSNGTITLIAPLAGNQQGSIFKGTNRFLHTYHGSGTDGYNTFLGLHAGNFSMGGTGFQGSYNTGVGYQALFSNSTGNSNTANGYNALYTNNTGAGNTANGYAALYTNSAGIYNTANGYAALYTNSIGFGNTANGSFALYTNSTGANNTANGYAALYTNSTGDGNTANGSHALYTNSTGDGNTANGVDALFSNSTGNYNTANGVDALRTNSTGNYNTAIGTAALRNNSTGDYNTANGFQALYDNSTGSYNTALGYGAGNGAVNRQNTIVLAGNGNILPTGDNQVRIGNSSMTSIGGQVGWTTISDERTKTNFQDNVPGLAFIMKLKPLTYQYDVDKENELMGMKKAATAQYASQYDIQQNRFSGFRAQEVEKAAQEIGYSFSGVDKPQDPNGLYGLRYAEFTVPLVKAVQEQQQQISDVQQENRLLKQQIAQLQEQLNKLLNGTVRQ